MATNTKAQDTNATNNSSEPKSEAVKQLEEQLAVIKIQKEIAENKKLIYDYEQAKNKAVFDTKPVEGKTTTTGQHIETKILAHKALQEGMDDIVKTILIDQGIKSLILYDETIKDQVISYNMLTTNLENFRINYVAKYRDLKSKIDHLNFDESPGDLSAVGFLTGTYAVVQALAVLVSAFNTDITYNISDVTFSEAEVLSHLVQAIKANDRTKDIQVYAPSVFPIIGGVDSEILNVFTQLKTQKEEFMALKKILKNKENEGNELLKNAPEIRKKTTNEVLSKISELNTIIDGHVNNYNALFEQINKVDDKNKSLLSVAYSIENTVLTLQEETTRLIQIEVKASGSTLTRTGWFVYDRIEFSGGSILSANLITNKGEIVNSYTGAKIKPLKKRNTY